MPKSSAEWVQDYDLGDMSEADLEILGRFETPEAAFKSIPEARKKIGAAVIVPGADTPPAELEQSHREILRKLGLPDEKGTYGLDSLVTDDLKAVLTQSELEALPSAVAKDEAKAKELGLLPWQARKLIGEGYGELVARRQAEQRASADAAAEVEKALEKAFGAQKEDRKQAAIAFARHMDDTLFAVENQGLAPEVVAEKGGVLQQLIRQFNHPLLWRLHAVMYDTHLGEGSLESGTRPGAEKSDFAQRLAAAKLEFPHTPSLWPKR